jgi:hypothetical protein
VPGQLVWEGNSVQQLLAAQHIDPAIQRTIPSGDIGNGNAKLLVFLSIVPD